MKLSADKCKFFARQIKFLGFFICDGKVTADKEKVEAIANFPRPNTRTKIRGFLGLTGFLRSWSKNYTNIARPLQKMTKNGVKIVWNEEEIDAFEKLKEEMIGITHTYLPDFSIKLELESDSSDHSIGYILFQTRDNKICPIAYGNRCLTKAEMSYSVSEKELLAAVYGVTKNSDYDFS